MGCRGDGTRYRMRSFFHEYHELVPRGTHWNVDALFGLWLLFLEETFFFFAIGTGIALGELSRARLSG